MSGRRTHPRLRLAYRATVLVVVAAVLVAGVDLAVRASDGAFDGSYPVVGMFGSAGQGLHPGSGVDFRGVQVGQVGTIAHSGRRVRVVMQIDPPFRVPADATATIRPQNLFGAEDVTFTTASPAAPPSPPWIAPGGSVTRTAVSSQLDDLFAAADPLLSTIDTTALSSTISELDQGTAGQGPAIASGIDEGAKLAALLGNTLGAQLTALDSLTALSGVLAPEGPAFDDVAAQVNTALPAINRSEAAYQRLVASLTPLAENVAQFLSRYRPDIGTLLTTGANVTRVLLANQQNIETLVKGAYEYVSDIARAPSAATLPDGSHYAYFQIFIDFSDVNSLVCNLVAPAAPNLAFLQPLQQALDAPGSPFDCSAQVAAFDSLPQSATTPAAGAVSPATPGTATPATGTPSAVANAARQAAGSVYQSLGQPQVPVGRSLQGVVTMLLGGS